MILFCDSNCWVLRFSCSFFSSGVAFLFRRGTDLLRVEFISRIARPSKAWAAADVEFFFFFLLHFQKGTQLSPFVFVLKKKTFQRGSFLTICSTRSNAFLAWSGRFNLIQHRASPKRTFYFFFNTIHFKTPQQNNLVPLFPLLLSLCVCAIPFLFFALLKPGRDPLNFQHTK